MIESGPIIIAVSSVKARDNISSACEDYPTVCRAVREGRVRVLEVSHDGPWIRDYGPQIGLGQDGRPIVFDAEYNDVRQKQQVWRKREETDVERLALIQRRESLDSYTHKDDDEQSGDQPTADDLRKHIDERLAVLAQLKDVYSDEGILSRDEDDVSPFFLAQAAFRSPVFHVVSTGVTIDGGNLMRLGQDVCATTSDVVAANKANVDLDRVLRETYGCHRILYLSPLPGPVIKHVDMFLLPVDDRKVLLASYDPGQEELKRHWADADDNVRNRTMEAALAMDANAKILANGGFQVVRVSAPLPRSDPHFGTYYPTNLNALVRVDPRGRQHILVPTYEDYEDDVQAVALRTVREAFPPDAVKTTEATAAGQRQGAVHCLALVLPLDATVFADSVNVEKWQAWTSIQNNLVEKEKVASARLVGKWRVPSNKSVQFEFTPSGMMALITDDGLSLRRYSVRNAGSRLELSDPDKDSVETFAVEWQSSNHVRLSGHGDGTRVELVRLVEGGTK
jgi:agmatine/peptidylarginine deiminase